MERKYYKVFNYHVKGESLVVREDYPIEEWGIAMSETLLQTIKTVNPELKDINKFLLHLLTKYYTLN